MSDQKIIQLFNLMVEHTKTPIGIDVEKPNFSWQMTLPSEKRGYVQSAYQIVVIDEKNNIVWDSTKVKSDRSLGIQYNGTTLEPTERYTWTVHVWDKNNNKASAHSWFETGLMNPDPNLSAWNGATWIGGTTEDLPFYSDYLSVFQITYTLGLQNGSTKASFVLNANDSRLMDKYKNIYQMENGIDESYVKFELDVANVDGTENGAAKLNVYRVGFVETDSANSPYYTVDLPLTKLNIENKDNDHDFVINGTFGVYQVFMDGLEPEDKVMDVVVNPVGDTHDYLTHVGMVANIGFSVDAGQSASFKNVEVNHCRPPANPLFKEDLTQEHYTGIFAKASKDPLSGLTIRDGAYVIDGGTTGAFIVKDPSRNSMPMLRTQFSAEGKKIRKARLYATARGIYNLFLNGERVGTEYFNPGYTQYNITHMYQTYDVTDMIKDGENALGAMLGEGWWSGLLNYGSNWNYFGDRQSLLAKLVITYEDDTSKIVTTNPTEWKYYNDGPIRYGSFFMGEVYDSTKEAVITGWSTGLYDDGNWKQAVEVPLNEETTWNGYSYHNLKLIGQIGENASVVQTLTAKSVTEVRPGVFVYDMGQNMVGVPKITIKNGKANQKITIRVAEVLYPDLPESGDNVGMIMQENLRAALNQDLYICKDGEQVISPNFTFHGYRYIEITGVEAALPLDAVQGVVISSIKNLSSSYTTSNKLVNKLWENITWSMRGNFLSIPTDTPARNERMGWNGDISVFSRTATYLAHVNQFLRRHNRANRDMQSPDGRYSDVAPVGPGFGGILWGSAGIIVPWEVYQQYGDKTILEEHYDSMKKYMNYLASRVNTDTGLIDEGPLGDWLSPEYNQADNVLLWTTYHAYDLKLLAKISRILGLDKEADQYGEKYQERKEFFNNKFIDAQTKKTIRADGTLADTQASYAVPLAFEVIKEEYIPHVVNHLAASVKRKNIDHTGITRPEYSLMTGFIGTPVISQALSDHGYNEEAYRLLQQTSYPSWLYSVKNGATTIWERLNSYTVEEGFGGNNSMNSFNHYSFGAVGAWMYAYSLGIQRDEQNPGFKHFILQPTPDPTGEMTWAKGQYDSMYGRIESAWSVEAGTFTYKATVPANTTATVYIPTINSNTVMESGQTAAQAKGVKFVEVKNGKAIYELGSGSYEFRSVLGEA